MVKVIETEEGILIDSPTAYPKIDLEGFTEQGIYTTKQQLPTDYPLDVIPTVNPITSQEEPVNTPIKITNQTQTEYMDEEEDDDDIILPKPKFPTKKVTLYLFLFIILLAVIFVASNKKR